MDQQEAPKPPSPGASPDEWQAYALQFDGYEYAGGADALRVLYSDALGRIKAGEAPVGTTDGLRAVLFAHQRHYRHMEMMSAEEEAREQHVADAILAALQDAP